MKARLFSIVVMLFCAIPLFAQRLSYDLHFGYWFDNTEFDRSGNRYQPSATHNSILFTPAVGVAVGEKGKVSHSLMAGLDIRKNFGAGPLNYQTIGELSLYYKGTATLSNGAVFEGALGVLPRRLSEERMSEAVWSDSLRFYDSNIDGLLLKYRAKRFYAELAADWLGLYGQTSRERFQIWTAGHWNTLPWLSIGWSALFYHYACSMQANGVVDMHMLNPYVKFDLGAYARMQELSFRAGAIASYQRDRVQDRSTRTPAGAELTAVARKWNVQLQNTAWIGSDIQPLRHLRDVAGIPYGNDLYFGSAVYHSGFYDQILLSWTPRIWRSIYLRLCLRFHFDSTGYLGSQQQISFVFDLKPNHK